MGGKSRTGIKVEPNRQPVGLSKNTTGASQGIRAAEGEDAPVYTDPSYEGPRPKLSLKSKLLEYIESDQFPRIVDTKDVMSLLKKFPEESNALGLTTNAFFKFHSNYDKGRLVKHIEDSLPKASVHQEVAPRTDEEDADFIKHTLAWKQGLDKRFRDYLHQNTRIEEYDGETPMFFTETEFEPGEPKKVFAVQVKNGSPLSNWSHEKDRNNYDPDAWLQLSGNDDTVSYSKEKAEQHRRDIIENYYPTANLDDKLRALNEEYFTEITSTNPIQTRSNVANRSHLFNLKEISLKSGDIFGFNHQEEHKGDIAKLVTSECFTRDIPASMAQDLYLLDGPLTKTLHLERLNSKVTQYTRVKAELLAEAEGIARNSPAFEARIKQLSDTPHGLEKAQDQLATEKKKSGYTEDQFKTMHVFMWSADNLMKKVAINGDRIGTKHVFIEPDNAKLDYVPAYIDALVKNGFIKNGQEPHIDSLIENYLSDPDYLTNLKKSPAVKSGLIAAKDLNIIEYLAEDHKKYPDLKRLTPVNPTGFVAPYNYYAGDIKRITLLSLKTLIQNAVKNGIKRVTWEGGQREMHAHVITGNHYPLDADLFNDIIPEVAGKYIKQFNGKLEEFSFTQDDETPSGGTNMGFNITPEMEKAVRENRLELV